MYEIKEIADKDFNKNKNSKNFETIFNTSFWNLPDKLIKKVDLELVAKFRELKDKGMRFFIISNENMVF